MKRLIVILFMTLTGCYGPVDLADTSPIATPEISVDEYFFPSIICEQGFSTNCKD